MLAACFVVEAPGVARNARAHMQPEVERQAGHRGAQVWAAPRAKDSSQECRSQSLATLPLGRPG